MAPGRVVRSATASRQHVASGGAAVVVNLAPLLSPRSVAVVGASQAGGRATGAIRSLNDLGFEGPIYPVNPRYDEVLGLPCYPRLEAIPGDVDLVAIGIPSERVFQVLEEAHQKGIRAAVIFASGYGEAGEVGRSQESELQAFAARTGMLICGPNCLGVLDLHGRSAGYSSTSPKGLVPGDVAVVSQSGTIIVALVRSLRGIGFSRLVSSGNEAVVTTSDYLRAFLDDDKTRVLAAFIEGIKDPQAFLSVADAALERRKPLIVIKTGRSEAGGAATAAHTGSLAGSYEVQRAVFRQKGVVLCEDPDEWIEAIELFRYARAPKAVGVGIIGVSGGENALVLDHAADLGLHIPVLSEVGREKLAAILPWYARAANPIDPTGAFATDPDLYRKCLEVLAQEPEIGVIAVSQDSPAHFDVAVAEATAQAAAASDKCFVYFSNFSGPYRPEVQAILRQAGVPYLQGIRESLKAIKALMTYHAHPQPTERATAPDHSRRDRVARLCAQSGAIITEDVAKALLAEYGFPVVRETLVASADEAVAAALAFGYPVVAKVVSADVTHKAVSGGVRLNLASPEDLMEAVRSMREDIGTACPDAVIKGFVVQPMVRPGIEVILGIKRDPQFGPTLVFGLGGIFVEAIRDVAIRLAPLSAAEAGSMVEEVPALQRMAAKLGSRHDLPGVAASLLLKLSELAADLPDEVEAVDINPVILDPASGTATVVDALIVKSQHEGR